MFSILAKIEYRNISNTMKIKIKGIFARDVLYKLINGVNIINISPIKLVIKNRGYLKILSQKLFIS
jgi:hypothetical protein